MANIDKPFGLRPVNRDGSAGYTGQLRKVIIQASESTDLFPGDPVVYEGTSVLDLVDGAYYPTVVRATAGTGNYISGVIVEFIPDTEASLQYKTDATTQRSVLIADDPYQLYEIQADGSVAVTDVGNTADVIFTTSGDTNIALSGAELKTADIGTGTQLVIEGVRQQDRNDLSSANPVLVVRINEHQKRNTTGV